jgi:hypothetical protein
MLGVGALLRIEAFFPLVPQSLGCKLTRTPPRTR